ncbi:unnamed protein product [Lampetra fluviatilis]
MVVATRCQLQLLTGAGSPHRANQAEARQGRAVNHAAAGSPMGPAFLACLGINPHSMRSAVRTVAGTRRAGRGGGLSRERRCHSTAALRNEAATPEALSKDRAAFSGDELGNFPIVISQNCPGFLWEFTPGKCIPRHGADTAESRSGHRAHSPSRPEPCRERQSRDTLERAVPSLPEPCGAGQSRVALVRTVSGRPEPCRAGPSHHRFSARGPAF